MPVEPVEKPCPINHPPSDIEMVNLENRVGHFSFAGFFGIAVDYWQLAPLSC